MKARLLAIADKLEKAQRHSEESPIEGVGTVWADTDEVISAQLEIRRLADELAGGWTSDPPTEPGLYWCAGEGSPVVRFTWVFEHDGHLQTRVANGAAAPVANAGCWWWGPLAQPDLPPGEEKLGA